MSHDSKLLRRFRHVAVAEGISFLVLLFLAMPLKYGLGIEEPVKIVGWLHGVLFVAYCYYVVRCWYVFRWSILFAAVAFLASLLPFGPFIIHRWIPEPKKNAATSDYSAVSAGK